MTSREEMVLAPRRARHARPPLRAHAARWRRAVMRRHTVAAGVLDAALSSLASFAVGLYAARLLDPVQLGAYALAFTAYGLAVTVPAQLTFTPLEIAAVSYQQPVRLRFIRRSLVLGGLSTLLPALAIPGWMLFAPRAIPIEVAVGLSVTAVATAIVSPPQDHLRRMLHIAGVSWCATVVSVVQLVVVATGLVALRLGGAPPWWAPFGALALANLVSLITGLVLARRREHAAAVPAIRITDVMRSGRWMLLTSLVPTGAAFIASVIAAHIAGAAILGHAEVARLSGQPVMVLAIGLAATLGPGIVAAAQAREPRRARRVTTGFVAVIAVAAGAYLALVGGRWRWNPLAWLLPNAYTIPGLVAVTILANVTHGISYPARVEALGAGKEVALTKVELVGNAVRVAIAGAAGVLGAFVIPLGILVVGVVRWLGCRVVLRSHYTGKVP
ncbi:MAG TPA: hypothetical protein VF041_18585 [Gemmatimonadaceae bacterium]